MLREADFSCHAAPRGAPTTARVRYAAAISSSRHEYEAKRTPVPFRGVLIRSTSQLHGPHDTGHITEWHLRILTLARRYLVRRIFLSRRSMMLLLGLRARKWHGMLCLPPMYRLSPLLCATKQLLRTKIVSPYPHVIPSWSRPAPSEQCPCSIRKQPFKVHRKGPRGWNTNRLL